MSLSRRNMLKLSAAAAALCATGLEVFGEEGKKIPVGLELYSVRDDMKKDLPGTIAAVAKMGYVGVEFAGYFGRSAEDLKKILDENHVVCPSTHIPGGLDALTGDNLAKSIAFHKTLGCNFLIVPYMDANRYLKDMDTIKRTADIFNAIAEKLKPEGMRVGYHAHAGDVEHKVGDKTVWEAFFSNTSADVIMQLDTDNVLSGGGNPYALLKEFPGRAATIHIKEHGGKKGAPIGQGEVRWNEIFELCETIGKTQWYIVEHESYATTPLESVKADFEALKKMGKV